MRKILRDMISKHARKNPKNNMLNYYPWDVKNKHLFPDDSSSAESSESEEEYEPYVPSQQEKQLLL